MNNIIDKKKIEEIKDIINNCNTYEDAYILLNQYLKFHPDMKEIGKKLLDGTKFSGMYNYDHINYIIDQLLNNNQHDYNNILHSYYPFAVNATEIWAFIRVVDFKKNNNIPIINTKHITNKIDLYLDDLNDAMSSDDITFSFKNCPHCNQKTYKQKSDYMICGFTNNGTNNGYDGTGCYKDWCYKCGKKLCKSWMHNKLFDETNRYHDTSCCKKYALTNCIDSEEFCSCNH